MDATYHKAFKARLITNNRESGLLNRCASASRYVYNWALADRIYHYKIGEKTNRFDQCKRFNAIKDELCPWIRELPYAIVNFSFLHLDSAYQNFFRRVKGGAEKAGFPKFKNRYSSKAFTINGAIKVEPTRVRLPVIGWMRLMEHDYIPVDADILYATMTERAGNWYISVTCEIPQPDQTTGVGGVIGVDVGIKTLASLSTGETFYNPRPIYQYEAKLKRLQRELARRTRGGKNYKKTLAKKQAVEEKIRNIRGYAQHTASTAIIDKNPATVVVESLNVSGMLKNHKLARSISDVGMGEILRQIKYKSDWHGIEILEADRWYPSSKMCSACGHKKETLSLGERIYKCDNCGLVIDRDLNAAINLAALVKGETHPDCLGSCVDIMAHCEPGSEQA